MLLLLMIAIDAFLSGALFMQALRYRRPLFAWLGLAALVMTVLMLCFGEAA